MDDTLTLEKLNAMLAAVADIPPPPFFASSKLLPSDHAVRFKLDGRDYAGAHPDFWAKVPKGDASARPMLGAIEIFDIDSHSVKRAEFMTAMATAMRAKPLVWPSVINNTA